MTFTHVGLEALVAWLAEVAAERCVAEHQEPQKVKDTDAPLLGTTPDKTSSESAAE